MEAVNAFLRSGEKTKCFSGFNDIGHARNWSSKYFGSRGLCNGYSARASPDGRGKGTYVTVTKTKASYKALLLQYSNNTAELKHIVETLALIAFAMRRLKRRFLFVSPVTKRCRTPQTKLVPHTPKSPKLRLETFGKVFCKKITTAHRLYCRSLHPKDGPEESGGCETSLAMPAQPPMHSLYLRY